AGPRGPEGEAASRLVRGTEPGSATLPAQVHESRKSVLLPYVTDQAALGTAQDGTPLLMALRAASLLVVPVDDGNASYGALTAVRSASSGPFTLAEQALAEDLAGHLAVAMRVDQMFRARAETAEALQASLLPEELGDVPGLELAASYVGATRRRELSGDFYDVFRTPDGWAVAIGDVSGIGQEAAAISAAPRHSLRALAHVHDDPADVLSAASRVLLSGAYGERFVTALLAMPEAKQAGGFRVRLANAGHPGPAVVRADGRVEMGSGTALPLGLLPDDSVPHDTGPGGSVLDLDPGDVLFLYTDGVTQARDEDDEFFDDRLADALAAIAGRSAAETVSAVTERLSEFCRGDYRDDITVLAIRVR
ncbi:MAG: SpoIIE family protein phosphatase, partial [Nocardiopsaceae bacterium]|nr:SpoIIE family protein phosphatase [Nocardiopsaceae bacterium]